MLPDDIWHSLQVICRIYTTLNTAVQYFLCPEKTPEARVESNVTMSTLQVEDLQPELRPAHSSGLLQKGGYTWLRL